jgi:hypothetical protein
MAAGLWALEDWSGLENGCGLEANDETDGSTGGKAGARGGLPGELAIL